MKSVCELAEEVFDASAAAFAADERAHVFSGTRGGESFEIYVNCIPVEVDDEPIFEGSSESARRAVTLRFKASDWTIPTPPRIGDVATNAAGVSFAVTRVSRVTRGIFKVSARQKES